MRIYSHKIDRRHLAVAIDITFQMYLHILHHIAASHRDGVLPCNMVLLHHLHGVGAGSHARDGVVCGVALNEDLIGRLGCTALNELHGDTLAIAAVAGDGTVHLHALGYGGDRDILKDESAGIIARRNCLSKRTLISPAVDRCPSFTETEAADGIAERIMRVFDLQLFDGSVGIPCQGLNGQSGRENTVVCRGRGLALVQREW